MSKSDVQFLRNVHSHKRHCFAYYKLGSLQNLQYEIANRILHIFTANFEIGLYFEADFNNDCLCKIHCTTWIPCIFVLHLLLALNPVDLLILKQKPHNWHKLRKTKTYLIGRSRYIPALSSWHKASVQWRAFLLVPWCRQMSSPLLK